MAYLELKCTTGFASADGKTSFGVSIEPLKRKVGGDADAEVVAPWKIEGWTRILRA
jgi:hypothetical protein